MNSPIESENPRESNSFQFINKNAAGIDIGSGEHWVCVPSDRAEQNVRSFGCFTPDLMALAEWLIECQVETVAMEATGVYWIPLFQILEAKGLEVNLVNAHHVKTVPGRKSDVLDCQGLQKLHTFGLLSASFRPNDQICVLRSYIRQRETLIKEAGTHIQRMQKALIQMNLQLHKVISDINSRLLLQTEKSRIVSLSLRAKRKTHRQQGREKSGKNPLAMSLILTSIAIYFASVG